MKSRTNKTLTTLVLSAFILSLLNSSGNKQYPLIQKSAHYQNSKLEINLKFEKISKQTYDLLINDPVYMQMKYDLA